MRSANHCPLVCVCEALAHTRHFKIHLKARSQWWSLISPRHGHQNFTNIDFLRFGIVYLERGIRLWKKIAWEYIWQQLLTVLVLTFFFFFWGGLYKIFIRYSAKVLQGAHGRSRADTHTRMNSSLLTARVVLFGRDWTLASVTKLTHSSRETMTSVGSPYSPFYFNMKFGMHVYQEKTHKILLYFNFIFFPPNRANILRSDSTNLT